MRLWPESLFPDCFLKIELDTYTYSIFICSITSNEMYTYSIRTSQILPVIIFNRERRSRTVLGIGFCRAAEETFISTNNF